MSIPWDIAWNRSVRDQHQLIAGKKQKDFRSIHYTQIFTAVALGQTTAGQLQNFPGGGFILGIEAAAVVPQIAMQDQYYASAEAPDTSYDRLRSCTPGNLDLFSLMFNYTNDEIITPGGPCLAAALLGPHGDRFPTREILMDPSQGLLCAVKNEFFAFNYAGAAPTDTPQFNLNVHVLYRCMVPRNVG